MIISRLRISYADIDFIDKNSRFFDRKIFNLDYFEIYNFLKNMIKEEGLSVSYYDLDSKVNIKGIVLYNIETGELENLINNLDNNLKKRYKGCVPSKKDFSVNFGSPSRTIVIE